MNLTAGQLNRRIQIQNPSTKQDSLGQPLTTWETIYSCWAGIDIQNSQLIYNTEGFISKVTYRITLRWTSSVNISAKQHVVYTEPTTGVVHEYEIQAVLNDKAANKQLVLMCYEVGGSE